MIRYLQIKFPKMGACGLLFLIFRLSKIGLQRVYVVFWVDLIEDIDYFFISLTYYYEAPKKDNCILRFRLGFK